MRLLKILEKIMFEYVREFLQLLSLGFCFAFPIFFDLTERIKKYFVSEEIDLDNIIYYFMMQLGNIMLGIIFSMIILFKVIRVFNKRKILNSGNFYHNKPYIWYWICAKILGYEKCNLILVPIYTQYKLITRDTFNEYPFDENIFPQKYCNITINREFKKDCVDNKEINLIIQDTYPILKEQIPLAYRSRKTIIVKREQLSFGERVYSNELVNAVISEIRMLDNDIILNIFSTTNPKHTYEIAKKAIALADRGNVNHLFVFQQNRDGQRAFKDKPYKIF